MKPEVSGLPVTTTVCLTFETPSDYWITKRTGNRQWVHQQECKFRNRCTGDTRKNVQSVRYTSPQSPQVSRHSPVWHWISLFFDCFSPVSFCNDPSKSTKCSRLSSKDCIVRRSHAQIFSKKWSGDWRHSQMVITGTHIVSSCSPFTINSTTYRSWINRLKPLKWSISCLWKTGATTHQNSTKDEVTRSHCRFKAYASTR